MNNEILTLNKLEICSNWGDYFEDAIGKPNQFHIQLHQGGMDFTDFTIDEAKQLVKFIQEKIEFLERGNNTND